MNRNVLELLNMISSGSEYAFRELFKEYNKRVYTVALGYMKQPSQAEEVVQDVFLKLWLNRETLNELNNFEAWLYTVTRNIIFTRFKKLALESKLKRNYLHTIDLVDNDSSLSHTFNKEYEKILQKALSFLPEQQRAVYRLIKEEDLSYKEAAEQLNISPLTVKTHMTRSMNFVRNFIKKNGEIICLIFLLQKI